MRTGKVSRPATRKGIASSCTRFPTQAVDIVAEHGAQRAHVGRGQDQAFLALAEVADRFLLGASGLGVRLLDRDLGDGGDHLAAVEVLTFEVVLEV